MEGEKRARGGGTEAKAAGPLALRLGDYPVDARGHGRFTKQ